MRYDLKRCFSGNVLIDGYVSALAEAGFIVISAFKGGDPSPRRRRKYQFNSRSLREDIQQSRYSYIPVWGSFDEWDEIGFLESFPEAAFIVFNCKNHREQEDTEELLSLAHTWRKQYDVEVLLYSEPGKGGKAHYLTDSESIELCFGSVSPSVAVDIYFRYLHSKAREKYPKTLFHEEERIYLARRPNSVNEAYMRRGEIFIRP